MCHLQKAFVKTGSGQYRKTASKKGTVFAHSFDGLLPFELPPGQLNDSTFAAVTAAWPAEMKSTYPLTRFDGNTNAPLAMSDGDCCVVCAGYEVRQNTDIQVHFDD